MASLCKYWAFAFILCQLGQQHMLLNGIGSMGSFLLLGLGALLLLINSGRVFDRKTVASSPFIYSFVFISSCINSHSVFLTLMRKREFI